MKEPDEYSMKRARQLVAAELKASKVKYEKACLAAFARYIANTE